MERTARFFTGPPSVLGVDSGYGVQRARDREARETHDFCTVSIERGNEATKATHAADREKKGCSGRKTNTQGATMLVPRAIRWPKKQSASRVSGRRRPVGVAWARWAPCLGVLAVGSALLVFDEVPNRITNQRRATFTYVCTPLDVAEGDDCAVKVSCDEDLGRERAWYYYCCCCALVWP